MKWSALFLVVLFSAAGCAHGTGGASSSAPKKAKARLNPTAGHETSGTVSFVQQGNVVLVHAVVDGLTPGAHGFHVHEHGDCSAPDASSAGGHFNPGGHQHAGPAEDERHAGDLGNLVANADGHAVLEWHDSHLQLSGQDSIIGRAVIVHAEEDDLKSQPTGNAGGRVACGVIEAAP